MLSWQHHGREQSNKRIEADGREAGRGALRYKLVGHRRSCAASDVFLSSRKIKEIQLC
jgi:hypothetical protein